MINRPQVVVVAASFQLAWLDAARVNWRIELAGEDSIVRGRAVVARDDAQGGMGLGDGHWFATDAMPFPQTSEPVRICARVNAFADDRVSLQSSNGGNMQSLARQTAERDGWQWLRFGVFSAAEIGETFRLYQIRPQRGAEQTFLDSVVLASDAEMSETELDAVLAYTQRHLAAVGRAQSAPTIDGSIAEAAWNEANLPDSAVLEHDGKHLVAIMNAGGKPRTYQFRLPETGFTEGIEYYSGQAVEPGQLVELELLPGAAAAYVLE